jgi:hypothetical protein
MQREFLGCRFQDLLLSLRTALLPTAALAGFGRLLGRTLGGFFIHIRSF